MHDKILKLILSIFVIAFLTSCGKDDAKIQCVEGDDWGYPKVFTSAEGKDNSLIGNYKTQDVLWSDSGRVVLGADSNPLIITVSRNDKWAAWNNGNKYLVPPNKFCEYRDPLAPQPEFETSVLKAQGHPNGDSSATDTPDDFADRLTPCWLKDGYGLYMLADNPNTENDPVIHLADLDEDGYLVRSLPSSLGIDTNARLKFKIYDRYYDDNAGGYLVRLKKGTKDPEPGRIQKIVEALKTPIDQLVESLYKGIVENITFIRIVQASLSFYIMYLAINFMMGNKGNFQELFIAMFKIGLVIQLISPTSWEFFYNYLFVLFTDGVADVVSIVSTPTGEYDPGNPWWSIDQMFDRFFNPETHIKAASVIFANFPVGMFLGMIYWFVIVIAILMFSLAVLYIVLLYLSAYMILAILIILFPIFLIFMLFDFAATKDLPREWLLQAGAAFAQFIILFGVVGLFFMLIQNSMEATLGFNVCWQKLPYFGEIPLSEIPGANLDSWTIFEAYMYQPAIDISSDSLKSILVLNENGQYVMAQRYIDLPYLDPNNPQDMNKIQKMADGNLVNIGDLFLLIASIYLMYKFFTYVPRLADELKAQGGSTLQSGDLFKPGQAILGSAAEEILSPIGNKIANAVKNRNNKNKTTRSAAPKTDTRKNAPPAAPVDINTGREAQKPAAEAPKGPAKFDPTKLEPSELKEYNELKSKYLESKSPEDYAKLTQFEESHKK